MAKTRAQENRAIRQEALREQLAAQGHVQHAVEIVEKFNQPMDKEDQDRFKTKFDMHMRLVNKFLPDVKAVEMSVEKDALPHLISDKPMTEEDWEAQYAASLEPTGGSATSTH